MHQTQLDNRLAYIDTHLAGIEASYSAWNQELAQMSKDLTENGVDFWASLDAAHEMYKESIKSGDCPVDFDELHELLDELYGSHPPGLLDKKNSLSDTSVEECPCRVESGIVEFGEA